MRTYSMVMEPAPEIKEFFYIGMAHTQIEHYRILKIGTTKNLQRRAGEHRRKKDYEEPNYSLTDFDYIQSFKLSKANTLLLEQSVRTQLRNMMQNDELFQANDRFVIMHDEEIRLEITIKTKTYIVTIP